MEKIINHKSFFGLLFMGCLFAFACDAQTAQELNSQAKDLMTKRDFKNAIPILQRAAEMGNAEAQYTYGYCYMKGLEVPKNDSLAHDWILKAARQGWVDAERTMAIFYAAGRGIAKDLEQAFYWSRQCAEHGNIECMWSVVSCYDEGLGTAQNADSALSWAIRLGSQKEPANMKMCNIITTARANLAGIYHNARNDNVKSYMWYLIYNEYKISISADDQQKNLDKINEVEKLLTPGEKDKAKKDAEALLGRELKNLVNLHNKDI